MADVAAVAGVSHQTVSRVLNDSPLVRPETRERVLAAIEQLGYRRNNAARVLVTNRSGRIGVIAAHLAHYGPAMITASLQDAAHDAGYETALVGLPEITAASLRAAANRLLDQAVEAVVVAVAHRETVSLARSLAEGAAAGVPVVLVEGVLEGGPRTAGVDQVAGAVLATEHLLGLGHSSVAHLTGPLDWVEAEARRTGWVSAHQAAGAEPGREWHGDWTAASGYAAGVACARDPGVTAVFAANDQMALGVLRALREAGRDVPGDVSVVGFDDLPEAEFFSPPLTTVRQDFAELGRRAVDVTLRALRGEKEPGYELVAPTLIVRASTGRPVVRQS